MNPRTTTDPRSRIAVTDDLTYAGSDGSITTNVGRVDERSSMPDEFSRSDARSYSVLAVALVPYSNGPNG
jgi:hypothetical protein